MMRRAMLALAVLGLALQASAAIYPMEGGDLRRSGQSQSLTHVAGPFDVLWSSDLCNYEVRSNPVVLEDRIVQTFENQVVCVSRFDGQVIWRAGSFGGYWNPPAYDADRDLLYQSSRHGAVVALRPADGSVAWHYYEGQSAQTGSLASVTYWQNKIYVGTGKSRVVCLDADTQAVLWSLPLGPASGIGTPALDGGRLYVASVTGSIYCVDAVTGALLWQVNSPKGTCYSSAVSLDDTKLYLMTSRGKVECRLRSNGALQWSYQTGSWTLANLSVGPNGVYCTSDDRCMYRLDPANGAVLWQTCFQGNFARSSPFCHGDMVLGSGCTTTWYGVDSSTGSGVWDMTHGAWNSFTDFAEADGLLFVTNVGGTMYCLRPQNAPMPPTVTIAPSRTTSATPTPSASATETPSATVTPTGTATVTETATPTATASSSETASPSATQSSTVTPSASPTATASPSRTGTATASASATVSLTRSQTPTQSASATVSPTSTQTVYQSPVPTFDIHGDEGKRDPGDGKCYVSPNPVRGGPCRLVYRMKGPGQCRIRLFQASGDPVGLVEERHATAGLHSSVVSTQRYAPGVYFCRADISYDQGGGEKLPLTKFIVLKAR